MLVPCMYRSDVAACIKITSGFVAAFLRLQWRARERLLWLSVTMVVAVESRAAARERSSMGNTEDVQKGAALVSRIALIGAVIPRSVASVGSATMAPAAWCVVGRWKSRCIGVVAGLYDPSV